MISFSMPGGMEWLMILLFIGYVWLIIATVIKIATNFHLEMTHKLMWLLIIVVAPLLGAILYHVFNKRLARM